ncbi:MAG: DinB family protein [Stackebrandtia sp.]
MAGGIVPPTVDERDNLLKYVAQQRDTFRYIAHGLTDEQARLTPTAGELSIGGLIKHIAQMERNWLAHVEGREHNAGYEGGFTMGPDETLEGLLADLVAAGEETERAVAKLDLDHPVPVPPAPWFPKDVKAWSLRWVLGHLIEEMARHAGHGDIVRETIDGKTMYELQAMADGWHEDYLKMMAQFAEGHDD